VPRKRRIAKRRTAVDVPAFIMNWLQDEPIDESNREEFWGVYHLDYAAPEKLKCLWDAVKDEILSKWRRTKPGTRPAIWYRFDAPRAPLGTFPGCYYDGKLADPRRRISGRGKLHEGYVPSFDHALPVGYWIEETLSAAAPLVFESEASYLRRHKLLSAEEARRLDPSAFLPEEMEPITVSNNSKLLAASRI